MSRYIRIAKEDVIMEGITNDPWGHHFFIVYIDKRCSPSTVHINAYYCGRSDKKDEYEGNNAYDRRLCDDIGQLRKMTFDEIERCAYGAYMDGAR